MPEIIPNSDIRLMFDVPLTSQYENTYYFHDEEQQFLYFENHFTSITYTEQYYTRKRRGWLRINDTYNRVYNANYLFFRNVSRQVDNVANPPYENKSYYAFIDDVVYINDHTCEVHYTLDVIQTYMFTWSFHQCIIERESTNSDNLYQHIIDENIPVGDYVNSSMRRMTFKPLNISAPYFDLSTSFRVVIAATINKNYEDTTDGAKITSEYSGFIVGCQLVVPDRETQDTGWGVDALNSNVKGALKWLDNLPGEKQGAILGIYLVPYVFVNYDDENEFMSLYSSSFVEEVLGDYGSSYAYTPKNKKLLSFPFNSIMVVSSDGSKQIFDPAQFEKINNDFMFYLNRIYTAPMQGVLYPVGYKHEHASNLYSLPLPALPTCTWSNDTYKAWAALNTGYMISSIAGSVIDAGARIGGAIMTGAATEAAGQVSFDSALYTEATSNYWTHQLSDAAVARTNAEKYNIQSSTAKGIFGDIQNIANNIIAMNNAKISPDSFNGSAQNLATMIDGIYGFAICQRCIRPDYAQILDNYFTMFGYKVMRLGLPNLRNRTRFTYIKTLNCDIGGNIPNIDKRLICNIFNSGIRFWDDRDNLGSYVSDNIPLLNQ